MTDPYQNNIIALTIQVRGLVQGVGFRPFVFRLAQRYHLNGWVVNGTDGVTVKVEGMAGHMAPFVEDLRFEAPVVSQIDEIIVDQDIPEGLNGFFIMASQDLTDETSEISPDIAVCADCLADMKKQPHRQDYPFINCTHCGPRFSIIKDFPYDREKTTMSPFIMCDRCKEEYSEISDRRFHAQPVACNDCGPKYSMLTGHQVIDTMDEILDRISRIIHDGGIIALKGTGGFHLMCNALDGEAVNRLRQLKKREGKPFAVMFSDPDKLKKYAHVSGMEERALTSWRRPIVILNSRSPMAWGITLGMNTIGAFLPYMPIHYLLFDRLKLPAIVLTSGNIADEPIIIENLNAIGVFTGITDAVITYNREIFNRTDDSVVRVISDRERVFRRSRGYVPSPVRLNFDVEGIWAAGAELSNCFCLGKGNRAYLSQHIGDLRNHETFSFFEESFSRFQEMFRIHPTIVAADMHPDYLSTRFATKLGLKTFHIQHHHAHIASCMAENGLDEPVIGVAFDGTGYGTDGHIWGSEFLVADFENFERKMHFAYMPMPGGDRASEEPWRMGLALLYMAFGEDMLNLDLPLLKSVDPKLIPKITESIKKNINSPLSSGAGRLFDGIAAITGICIQSAFHAEAPMRLESAIEDNIGDYYPFEMTETLSFIPAIREICRDMDLHIRPGIIAAKFHNTVVEASLKAVLSIRDLTGIDKVVLTGGSFQNKYLQEFLESRLVKNNFAVFTHSKVPCNDGGIALGQLAVAARRRFSNFQIH